MHRVLLVYTSGVLLGSLGGTLPNPHFSKHLLIPDIYFFCFKLASGVFAHAANFVSYKLINLNVSAAMLSH